MSCKLYSVLTFSMKDVYLDGYLVTIGFVKTLIEILIQGVVCCEKFLLLSGRCIENVETKQET